MTSQQHTWSSNDHHQPGLKRPADDDLESEQRLAKRFNLLNLEHRGKLWMNPNDTSGSQYSEHVTTPHARHRPDDDDFMQVEDTKDKIYIHNLDAELAEVDAEQDPDRLIFVPDIERHLNRLPKHLLRSGVASDPLHQLPVGHELVLYSVPSSLSVPPEQDSVRRAILESRARSQREQKTITHGEMQDKQTSSAEAPDGNVSGYEGDDEAMEL